MLAGSAGYGGPGTEPRRPAGQHRARREDLAGAVGCGSGGRPRRGRCRCGLASDRYPSLPWHLRPPRRLVMSRRLTTSRRLNPPRDLLTRRPVTTAVRRSPSRLRDRRDRARRRWPKPQPGLEPSDIDPGLLPIRRVLPPGGEQPEPFRLSEATPDAVRLAGRQSVRSTLGAYRAAAAQLLRGGLPAPPGRTPLTVGVEELGAVPAPAQPQPLPIPYVGDGTGQPSDVRHAHPPSVRAVEMTCQKRWLQTTRCVLLPDRVVRARGRSETS